MKIISILVGAVTFLMVSASPAYASGCDFIPGQQMQINQAAVSERLENAGADTVDKFVGQIVGALAQPENADALPSVSQQCRSSQFLRPAIIQLNNLSPNASSQTLVGKVLVLPAQMATSASSPRPATPAVPSRQPAPSVTERQVNEAAQAAEEAAEAVDRVQDELTEAEAKEETRSRTRSQLIDQHKAAVRQGQRDRASELMGQILTINRELESLRSEISSLRKDLTAWKDESDNRLKDLEDWRKKAEPQLAAIIGEPDESGQPVASLRDLFDGLKNKADRTYVDDQIAKFQACQQIHPLCVLNEQGEYVGAESEAEATEEGDSWNLATFVWIMLGIGLLLLVGYLVYRFIRKDEAENEESNEGNAES